MAEQRDVENLHKEASGFYLKGDLQSALRVWREILTLRPQDVRAREGVRLCDQLADGTGVEQPSASVPEELPASTSAPSSSETADGPPVKNANQLDDLLKELDAKLAFDQPGTEGERSTGSGSGLWQWDKGTASKDAAPARSAARDPAPPVAESPGPSATSDPLANVAEAAAIELRRRVEELLDGARACREEGEQDEALSMLERVLILDEENETAQALKAEIERGAEEDEPALDLEEGIETHAERPEADSLPGLTADPEAEALTVGEIELDDLPDSDVLGDLDLDEPEVPPEETPAAGKSALKGRGPWMYGVAGAVLLAAAAFVVVRTLGTGEPEHTVAVQPAETDPGPAEAPLQEAAGDPSGATGEPTNDPATVERFEAFLADARAAFAGEDFEAAVLACGAALEIRPGHGEAAELMRKAAVGYREREELAGKWETAREAFDSGNYQEALRLFYRLPASDDPGKIERYKFNGWYNLGVVALRGGNCDRALENLDEAQQIVPGDPDLTAAFDLVEDCRTVAPDEYRELVRPLAVHALED